MTSLKRFSQFLLSALLLAMALPAAAAPVSETEMRLAVGRWLELKEQHFGAELSGPIRQAVRYRGGVGAGQPALVLQPHGHIRLGLRVEDGFSISPSHSNQFLWKNSRERNIERN